MAGNEFLNGYQLGSISAASSDRRMPIGARELMKDMVESSSAPAVGPADVSVSVVSHGQARLAASLLADLSAHVQTSIEVILTLNIAEPLCFDPADFGYPVRILRNSTPKGFAANQNAAFRESRGRYFCVLNPDIRLAHDPFPELVKRLQDRRIGVAAPLIRNSAGEVEDSARRFPTPLTILRKAILRRTEVDYSIGAEAVYPDWVAGMFMLFPRDVFALLGGFDERYFLYYEDVDVCARLALAGRLVVLCPSAWAVHDARRQSRSSLRFMLWHISSMLRYFLFWATRLVPRRKGGQTRAG